MEKFQRRAQKKKETRAAGLFVVAETGRHVDCSCHQSFGYYVCITNHVLVVIAVRGDITLYHICYSNEQCEELDTYQADLS